MWRRSQQPETADPEQPAPANGSGLAEAGFPEARGVFPLMPSPWDDPEFYTLGLHMGPPPPPPIMPSAATGAAAAASNAAAVSPEGGVLWQRDPADAAAAVPADGGALWRRDPGGQEAGPPQQSAGTSADAAAAAPGSSSSDNNNGSQLNGSAFDSSLQLPPRPTRMPIIPSRRMRAGRGGMPGPEGLQDDPAVLLDNLEDEETLQRRPLATADSGHGNTQ